MADNENPAPGASHQEGEAKSTLQTRLQQRLAELHLTPRRASIEAGLAPDAIRAMLAGRSRSPRAENLAAIAATLHCDIGYLLGTQTEPKLDDRPPIQLFRTPLYVTDRLGLGWKAERSRLKPAMTDLLPLEEYPEQEQSLELILDGHFDERLPPGTLVHVHHPFPKDEQSDRAFFERMAEAPLSPGEVVVLTRLTFEKEAGEKRIMQERSLREVRVPSPGIIMLDTRSRSPELQHSIMYEGPDVEVRAGSRVNNATGDFIAISAFALRAYQRLSGPVIFDGTQGE